MLYTFKRANGIIYVSKAIRNKIEKYLNVEQKNGIIIHHGVNERFKIEDKRLQIKEKDKINLLVVSSHALHKNLVALVKIISELRKNINLELTIIGPEQNMVLNNYMELFPKLILKIIL